MCAARYSCDAAVNEQCLQTMEDEEDIGEEAVGWGARRVCEGGRRCDAL